MLLLEFLQLLQQTSQDFLLQNYWTYYATTCVVMVVCYLICYSLCLPTYKTRVLEDVGYPYLDSSKYRKRKSKVELVKEIRRRKQLGVLPPVFPNGWYTLLDSSDIKVGQVKHVQALGENFAVMRSSTGAVHVLDAYCPHLGANMAVGGVVKGDCLECPFHGWQFRGEDGTCSHIPYSDKVVKSASVKRWVNSEVNNLILVWYHAEGEPPSWQEDRIPQIESGELWLAGRAEYITNCHVQDVTENLADFNHFRTIHGVAAMAGGDSWWSSRLWGGVLLHVWECQLESNTGSKEGHINTIFVKHTLELFGKYKLFPSSVKIRQAGPGLILADYKPLYTVVVVTPIEPLLQRTVHYFYSPPLLLPFAKLMMYFETTMLERDIYLWNNKKYNIKPLLIKDGTALANHKRWYSQFYTKNSPQYSSLRKSIDW